MTTLADRIVALATLRPGVLRHVDGNGGTILEIMKECERYVIRDDAEAIADEIYAECGWRDMPWPIENEEHVWLEISDRVEGYNVCSGLLLRAGGFGALISWSDHPGHHPWVVTPVALEFVEKKVNLIFSSPEEAVGAGELAKKIVDRYLILLHMIQQPRILDARPVAHEEKLQRSRLKSGKAPLFTYREVTVHVTRAERAADARAQELQERHGVRLHRVRPHYRVCRGVVQRIAAYWRGSAELGVVIATGHRVAR